MVVADRLSRFPSHKHNTPIEIHKNIQHVQFNPDQLNIIRGAIERDPVHATIYHLTLNGWSDRIQDVPHIACHLLGTRDELTIENGILLKCNRICNCKAIEEMQHLVKVHVYWPRIGTYILDYIGRYHDSGSTAHVI